MRQEDQDRMSELFLHRVYYPVTTLGYGKRLGVWVRGCGKACPGCISPELKEPLGSPVDVEEVIRRIPEGFEADGLTISGGEPFDQPRGVLQLIRWFSREISEDILIFTGYTIEELRGPLYRGAQQRTRPEGIRQPARDRSEISGAVPRCGAYGETSSVHRGGRSPCADRDPAP